MYQNNLKTYYNRHYGKAKVLNSPSAMLQKNNKKMLEEDSDDEFITHNSKEDHEIRLNEQKFSRIMFLVTVVILLVKLFKLTSEYILIRSVLFNCCEMQRNIPIDISYMNQSQVSASEPISII